MKEKLNYKTPETEQVKVQFEEHLLDGSINGARQSYGEAEVETWGE